MEFSRVKLEIYAPPECADAIREALNALGACHFGKYDSCTSITRVAGTWRPLPGAEPFQGTVGELCRGEEWKIEAVCPLACAREAVEAVRRVHPYEEPVIYILPILDLMEEAAK